MKDRLILAILIIILWIFLALIKVYLPFLPSTMLVLGFIIVYCLILAVAQYSKRKKTAKLQNIKDIKDYQPFVNIFIPAHNEEMVLNETIENLVKIDYSHYEILIIDDRSKDNTSKIAEALSQRYPDKVKLHRRPDDAFPGKSAVLNDALSMTEGEVVCVFDADAKVDPGFLKNIIPYLAEEKVAAVQARKAMFNKNDSLLTRCQHYEYCMDANVQLGRDSLRAAVEVRGNGELFKREALKAVDGWNNFTLTDDLDISTKLQLKGFDIRFAPDVIVEEEAVNSFYSIIKQRKRWAEGSIRRYLDYSDAIIASKEVSLKVSVDMIAYFSEFVLPIWLISDFIIQIIDVILGGKTDILLNLIVLATIAMFFIIMLFSSIIKFEKYGIFKALTSSIITAVFVIVLWTIVVANVVLKIIFTKRTMNWYKTERVASI